jgi:kynurenine 3-monooxygenase
MSQNQKKAFGPAITGLIDHAFSPQTSLLILGNAAIMANTQKVFVVGAGPVGSLAALYAARRGFDVEIYELRPGE